MGAGDFIGRAITHILDIPGQARVAQLRQDGQLLLRGEDAVDKHILGYAAGNLHALQADGADDDFIIRKACLTHQRQHALHIVGFQFDKGHAAVMAADGQVFAEQRHALLLIAQAVQPVALVHPQAAQLRPVHFADGARAVKGCVHRVVVAAYRHAVAGDVHVGFNGPLAQIAGVFKGGQRVGRSHGLEAAMAHIARMGQRLRGGKQLVHR